VAFTTHGHQIIGSPAEAERPKKVARCGGPGLCDQCSRDTVAWLHINKPKELVEVADENVKTPPPFRDYALEAQCHVVEYFNERVEKTDGIRLSVDDTYVVWFSKTLQNWKALVSTTVPDGMYYELTHDGDKKVTYLDAYKKFDNVAISDPI
jgi:hypothetical protein